MLLVQRFEEMRMVDSANRPSFIFDLDGTLIERAHAFRVYELGVRPRPD